MTTRVSRHPFVGTGRTDWRGRASECAHCPLPPGNEIHHMPETTQERRAYEARRTGESE